MPDAELEETLPQMLEPTPEKLIDNDAVLVWGSAVAEKAARSDSTAGTQSLSVVIDSGGDLYLQDKKKGSVSGTKRANDSTLTGNHNVFAQFPNYPNCHLCRMTKTTRARCNNRCLKRDDGISRPTSLSDLIAADDKILNRDGEGHDTRNAFIVQDGHSYWLLR